jgi:uncharacterized protein DUF6177
MVEPLTGHPAADTLTATAVLAGQHRRIVPRSTWLTDAAITAARSGRQFQLVTPPESRITYPLELMLADTGGRWVVRTGDTAHDGLTGQPLHWHTDRFTPPPGAAPARPLAPDSVWGGSVDIQLSTLHRPDTTLELGATTEAAVRALTGREPTGWGVAEPVTQPWSRRELTAHCRHRAPAPSSLVVVAHDVLGVVNVKRVRGGVLEEVHLSGPTLTSLGEAAFETLAADVAGVARSMVVAVHHGRSGGLRASTPSLPPLPYGFLAGRQVRRTAASPAPVAGAVAGRELPGGARWHRLGCGPGQPYEVLTAVLQAYGLPNPTG